MRVEFETVKDIDLLVNNTCGQHKTKTMSLLMVTDAIGIGYWALRTTVKGLYWGGSSAYQWYASGDQKQVQGQVNGEEEVKEKIIDFTEAEGHLLAAFHCLPEWVRQSCLTEALCKHNTETLVNFCFGETGSTAILEFLDLRTLSPIAQVAVLLDENRTIEQLRQALGQYGKILAPDFSSLPWYLQLSPSEEVNYARNQFISNSDSLCIFQKQLIQLDASSSTKLPVVHVVVDF